MRADEQTGKTNIKTSQTETTVVVGAGEGKGLWGSSMVMEEDPALGGGHTMQCVIKIVHLEPIQFQ